MRRELWMFSLVELLVVVGTFEVGFYFASWEFRDRRWKVLAESDVIGCHIDKGWSCND